MVTNLILKVWRNSYVWYFLLNTHLQQICFDLGDKSTKTQVLFDNIEFILLFIDSFQTATSLKVIAYLNVFWSFSIFNRTSSLFKISSLFPFKRKTRAWDDTKFQSKLFSFLILWLLLNSVNVLEIIQFFFRLKSALIWCLSRIWYCFRVINIEYRIYHQ